MEIKAPDRRARRGSLAAGLVPQLLGIVAALAGGYYLGTATDLPERVASWRKEAASLRAGVQSEGAPAVARRLVAAAAAAPVRLVLDVKHEDYQHLAYKRARALEHGFLVTDDDSFVPAKLTADGEIHEVKLRLKGDLVDHLQGKKWSFRIETRDGSTVRGMRRFSIQSPKRSELLKEWFLHRWLRHEGLIALRYDFVDVVLNGDPLGIYALEESFGKELVEHNCRREGPLLKFDEGYLMDPSTVGRGDMQSHEDLYMAADVHSFDSGRVLADDGERALFEQGRSLLDGVRNGSVGAADAFDLDRAARLYAMFDILQGGHHALRWKNVRFYVNPLLDRLELVAYNAYGLHKQRRTVTSLFYQDWLAGDVGLEDVQAWESVFFREPRFVEAYFLELRRIAAPGYLEGVLAAIEPESAAAMAVLNREFPSYGSPLPGYLANRRRVWEILNPKLPLRVYLERLSPGSAEVELLVVNPSFLPVVLDGLTCGGPEHPLPGPVLPGKIAGAPLEHRSVTVGGLSPDEIESLKDEVKEGDRLVLTSARLGYHLLGEDGSRAATIDAMPIRPETELAPLTHGAEQRLRRLEQQGVLAFKAAEGRVEIAPGTHRIDEDVVVPPGLDLRGGAGTTLLLERGAVIVSYSPVHLEGSAAAPLSIDSEDGTGQGLVVLQAGAASTLKHVRIRNMGSALKGRWRIAGAVTFVESDVVVSDSELSDGTAEDFLGVVRAKLRLERVAISRTLSDAVDVDFGTLEVVDSTFVRCGDDCIDLSGTTATMQGIAIAGAGGKGISAGEESHATVDGTIAGARIAVASKNGSEVRCTRLGLSDCAAGFAAYRGKPEHGGGTIDATGVTMTGVARPFLRDAASKVTVDGSAVEGEPPGEGDPE